MPRARSLKVIQRRIRELQAEAERLAHAEKPGIKQLRAVLKKFKLGLPDACKGNGSAARKCLDRCISGLRFDAIAAIS
jgi:hypothetical protein